MNVFRELPGRRTSALLTGQLAAEKTGGVTWWLSSQRSVLSGQREFQFPRGGTNFDKVIIANLVSGRRFCIERYWHYANMASSLTQGVPLAKARVRLPAAAGAATRVFESLPLCNVTSFSFRV